MSGMANMCEPMPLGTYASREDFFVGASYSARIRYEIYEESSETLLYASKS